MTSLPSRAAFARRVAAIKPGTSVDDVKQMLGPPDDIRTEHDPGGISAARTVEVWRYGTREHLGFGTLATVHIQADRKVQYVFGDKGAPPDGFDEAELRRLLEVIDAVPSYNSQLDPLALIRAVNALQPLGKTRALAVVDEYLRVSSWLDDPGREGMFLLMRALFEGPPAPVMMVGGPDVEAPADPHALPHWPIVFASDIPLDVVSGYALAGHAQNPEDDVAWFRKNGVMRRAPLVPPANPLEAVDAYIEHTLAAVIQLDDRRRIRLYDQALRLVRTVSQPASTVDGYFEYGADVAKRWAAVRAAIGKLGPAWDRVAMRYTRADGTALTDRGERWQRVWWDTGLPGAAKARLTVERIADDYVSVELRIELDAGARIEAGNLRVVDATSRAQLTDLAITATVAQTSTTGSVTSQRLKLPKGHAIRVELVHPGGTLTGPELAP